jgi:myo-inositol-1(or 4)-monophosphatase
MNDSDLISPISAAARQAADLLSALRVPVPAATWQEFKAAYDSAEKPVLDLLRQRLGGLRPGARWADEFSSQVGASGEYWVTDAIDGAVQLLQGLPQWCTAIALVRDGQPVLAVLHNPLLGQTYSAARGAGALLDGKPIRPSAKTDLGLALMATSHPPFMARHPRAAARTGQTYADMLGAAGAIRNLGPTSWQVADVASGRLDGFWEFGPDAGNLVGPSLIAREAGAVVSTVAGHPWTPDADSFLVAPPGLHQQLVAILARQPGEGR